MAEHCTSCPLQAARCVGWKGQLDAPLAIVGEAPGSEELRHGIPFVGPTGELLEHTLARAGLGDTPRLYTNALQCRPPVGEVPPPECINACRPRLLDELTAAPRKLLLLLGNSSMRSVLGNHGLKITQQRGKVVDTPYGLALLTYHPAYVLRNRGEFQQLVDDFRYAKQLLETGVPKSPGLVRFNVATEDTIDEFVGRLKAHKLLAVDIETTGFNPRHDRILCIGVAWAKNSTLIVPEELVPHLQPLLEDPTITFIWHNGKFDVSFLRAAGIDARVDADTMLMSYSLDEETASSGVDGQFEYAHNKEGRHGLKRLAADILGAPDWKDEVKKYLRKRTDSFEVVPKKVLYKYLAQDADNTFQLHAVLRERLEKEPGPLWAYEHILIPASAFLGDVEAHGFYIDRERLIATRAALKQSIQECAAAMYDASGAAINPRSSKQVIPVLNKLGIRTGSSAKQVLAEYKGTPFVDALLKYREEAKALGTYVDGLEKRIDTDGRLHPSFLLHGTRTGRLSCRNPNLMNITGTADPEHRIKKMFAAPPGRMLVQWDYSQSELRTLALMSKDPELMRVYIEGRDLHNEGAIELYGPGFTERQRFYVKTANFGIVYGRQAQSLAEFFNISFREAQALIDRFASRYPTAWRFLEANRRRAASGKYVQSAFGRRRRFRLVTAAELEHIMNEAANMPISSTSSDLVLLSGIFMQHELAAHDAFIINLVHDSMVAECPADEVTWVAEYGKDILEDTPIRTLHSEVPFVADVEVGTHWGELTKWRAVQNRVAVA